MCNKHACCSLERKHMKCSQDSCNSVSLLGLPYEENQGLNSPSPLVKKIDFSKCVPSLILSTCMMSFLVTK